MENLLQRQLQAIDSAGLSRKGRWLATQAAVNGKSSGSDASSDDSGGHRKCRGPARYSIADGQDELAEAMMVMAERVARSSVVPLTRSFSSRCASASPG